MEKMFKIESHNKDSFNIDSFINDEENNSDEEENLYPINDEKQMQMKDLHRSLINANLTRKLILKFNPKVVYRRCYDEKRLGEKYNLTYKFIKSETKLIKKILQGHGFEQVSSSSSLFNLMWTCGTIKPLIFKSLYPFQRVNHFPKSSELTRKDRLYRNIEKMQQDKGFKHFDFIPTTFILPNQLQQWKTTFEKEKGIWIVKPIASSQGKGIFLLNSVDNIPKDENLVLSRYIVNPLLIDGYKFDIRMYVAVTSYNPLVIYLYQEGLTRFATVKYDRNIANLSNSFMHLTNYSLNKQNHRYVRCDDPDIEDFGNKWTMSAMLRLLKSEGKDTFHLIMAIEDLIIKTFISVEYQISNACQVLVPNRANCFEVYGFDILIDDQLKPWLIEVNLSPSLNCDAPIDLKLKSHMICDLFNLISFPCFDIPKHLNEINSSPTHKFDSISVNEFNPSGLSVDQVGIIRRMEEEKSRHGGFIRIFPSEDTFEYFAHYFHPRKTNFNQIVHQYFYPDRWKKSSEENSKQIRRNHLPRAKALSSSFHFHEKNPFNRISSSDLQHAIKRYQLYHHTHSKVVHPHKITLEKSVIEKENSLSSFSSVQHSRRNQYEIFTPDHGERIVFNENLTRKSSLRVSSAPKQAYQRKFHPNSRSSRPISTNLQHKKRLSTHLSRKRSPSDNNSTNEEFVDQLKELSSKQHRRQYSVKGINPLPNESFDQAPREEKQILEKTAQILQENQLKNEQLAKQTKTFQEKIRRNEIYSALNRYSYRPPIYPSKSHRKNSPMSVFLDQLRLKSSS